MIYVMNINNKTISRITAQLFGIEPWHSQEYLIGYIFGRCLHG